MVIKGLCVKKRTVKRALDPLMINVAVGVVINPAHQILIAKRPEDKDFAGYWEFPGGKINPNESDWAALQRELQEEVGIIAKSGEHLLKVSYPYNDRLVNLAVWWVAEFVGQAKGYEGQCTKWVSAQQLKDYTFPPANDAIIKAIQAKLSKFSR